jgi:hypothetical protein
MSIVICQISLQERADDVAVALQESMLPVIHKQ